MRSSLACTPNPALTHTRSRRCTKPVCRTLGAARIQHWHAHHLAPVCIPCVPSHVARSAYSIAGGRVRRLCLGVPDCTRLVYLRPRHARGIQHRCAQQPNPKPPPARARHLAPVRVAPNASVYPTRHARRATRPGVHGAYPNRRAPHIQPTPLRDPYPVCGAYPTPARVRYPASPGIRAVSSAGAYPAQCMQRVRGPARVACTRPDAQPSFSAGTPERRQRRQPWHYGRGSIGSSTAAASTAAAMAVTVRWWLQKARRPGYCM